MARKKLYEGTSLITLAASWGLALGRSRESLDIDCIKHLLKHTLLNVEIITESDTEVIPEKREELPLRLRNPELTSDKAKIILNDIIELISEDNIDKNEYQSISNSGWIKKIYSLEAINEYIDPFLKNLTECSKITSEAAPESELKPQEVTRVGFPFQVAPCEWDRLDEEYDMADYDMSSSKDKIEFYSEYSDLIDLVNGDVVICDPKEESYIESDNSLTSSEVSRSSAIASVNEYMKSLHDLIHFTGHFFGHNWVKLPRKSRYYFFASDITAWLSEDQLKTLKCQKLNDYIYYFDLHDMMFLPPFGFYLKTVSYLANPGVYLNAHGIPDGLANRRIFTFPLNTIEFQEYQEWYIDVKQEHISKANQTQNKVDSLLTNIPETTVETSDIPELRTTSHFQVQTLEATTNPAGEDEYINLPLSLGKSRLRKSSIGFLDIETTGLSKTSNIITTAVLITKEEAYVFVNGKNLEQLPSLLDACQMLITFNGRNFDLPFIESQLGWQKKCDDIDLMLEFRRLGIRGGQKKIEKELGLTRGSVDMDGRLAIKLWSHYMNTSDPGALSSLLAYNYDDSLSLCSLLNILIEKGGGSESFALNEEVQSNPYKIDSSIVEQYSW